MNNSNIDSSDFTVTDFDDFALDEKTEDDIINVSDCLRLNSGSRTVRGTIVSISKLHKLAESADYDCLRCDSSDSEVFDPPINIANKDTTRFSKTCKCHLPMKPEYNYVNAVTVELQDQNSFSDIEKLTCILFDDDTRGIRVGENVVVSGNIHVTTRNKKSVTCLYSTTVEYENQEKTGSTNLDIEAVQRIVKLKGEQTVNFLSGKLFATSVIGFDIVKKGLLLSAVSSGVDIPIDNGVENRNRIHTIIVGDPGTGKSRLLRECSKLLSNSRYESSQHSSGKSLTAIVSKENDDYCLRIGSIALSHGSLCALNEIGRMSFDDQGFLLDVMEEGSFTINKYGINAKISSSTVIVASSNPMGSTWKKSSEKYEYTGHEVSNNNYNKYDDTYDEKIDLSKIPVLNPILDRFDLIFIIRNINSEEENRKYATTKTDQVSEPRKIPNYIPYLKKHLQYCKKFNPVLTDEAKHIINEFYVTLASSGSFYYGSSKRALEKLIRFAKAISRLKLKERVEATDAREALEFFNAVRIQYESSVISIPKNPKDRTVELFVEILKKSAFPYSLEELAKEACKRDEYIRSYLLGSSEHEKLNKNKFRIENNKKLRNAYEVLINNPNIQLVSSKPIVLKFLQTVSDPNDLSDSSFFEFKSKKEDDNIPESIDLSGKVLDTDESDWSVRSDLAYKRKETSLSNKIDKQNVDTSEHQNIQSQIKLKHSPYAEVSVTNFEEIDDFNNG